MGWHGAPCLALPRAGKTGGGQEPQAPTGVRLSVVRGCQRSWDVSMGLVGGNGVDARLGAQGQPRGDAQVSLAWLGFGFHPLCLSRFWKSHPIVATPGGLQAHPWAALGQIPFAAAAAKEGPQRPRCHQAQSAEHRALSAPAPSRHSAGMLNAAGGSRCGAGAPGRCCRRSAPVLSRNRLLPKCWC